MHVGTDFLKLPPVTGQYWSLFQCSVLGTGGTCEATFWHLLAHLLSGKKNMKKRLFGAMLTPKLHGTASCRHTEKGAALATCVYQCLQRGGNGAVT